MPADQSAVPGQQRGRGNDPMPPQLARQCPDQGGEHGPVRPGQARPTDLAAQHGDFVAQHQQLDDHLRLATRDLRQPAEHPNRAQVQQPHKHPPDPARQSKTPAHTLRDGFGTVQGERPGLGPIALADYCYMSRVICCEA
jgi:hypothetical protein